MTSRNHLFPAGCQPGYFLACQLDLAVELIHLGIESFLISVKCSLLLLIKLAVPGDAVDGLDILQHFFMRVRRHLVQRRAALLDFGCLCIQASPVVLYEVDLAFKITDISLVLLISLTGVFDIPQSYVYLQVSIFITQLKIACSLFAVFFQTANPALYLVNYVIYSFQISSGVIQLALSLCLSRLICDHAGRFFKYLPSAFRFIADYIGYLSLTYN